MSCEPSRVRADDAKGGFTETVVARCWEATEDILAEKAGELRRLLKIDSFLYRGNAVQCCFDVLPIGLASVQLLEEFVDVVAQHIVSEDVEPTPRKVSGRPIPWNSETRTR